MICTVVGARPNFIKMAPIILELKRRGIPQFFVHTGQHYDAKMSTIFFDELNMPQPDDYLGVGSGSHAEQTARILTAFEAVCVMQQPQLVMVAGDVNSTLACSLVAAKLQIPVAHVESGLRSFDRTMPEEINRVLTDHIADLLFTTEASGNENLRWEGIAPEKIHFVGNSMIDSLHTHLDKALARTPWIAFDVPPGAYGVVTFHRPSNVDDPATARELAHALARIGSTTRLIFPIHPRTKANSDGLWESLEGVTLVEPLGYLDFLGLMAKAKFVLTDSGGIQEETTALGVPCITVRHNTERPITLTEGTNQLVAPQADAIVRAAQQLPSGAEHNIPPLWDGHAAQRIVDVLQQWLASQADESRS
ncbi:MAG: UDP-N-acetylglucosamine 2-epimerase (non-hydrolyzing) [Anaerolineae bacterium]|nr:UDP-N-acetylglucosamine 2-epimerase (non-hydrolyzing) [Anaerolineae bacterium]